LAAFLFATLLSGPQSVFGQSYGSAPSPPPAAATMKFTAPSRGEIIRFVTLPGNVLAYQQATLYAKVPGYLKKIAVDKGDAVKADALLAEIEVPELEAELARYRAELTKCKGELAKYQAEVEVSELDYKRVRDAQKKAPDLVVEQAVDSAKARRDVAKGNHEMALANQEGAKANVERVETLLGFAKITAPFAGIVTKRSVDPGAFIPAATSGSAAQNAAIVTLMDFSTVRVQVPVIEGEAPLVAVGQPVKVSVEGLPGRSFDGKVTRHAFALDEATRTMLVEAELPNPKLELRPGMFAMVRIGVEKHADTLLIPVEGLLVERTGASAFLFADGKAKKTGVKIGFNDGTKVEILSGLTGSERVLLFGKAALNDGQAVNAVEAR
jgi:membrane fusion protein (multidrug efflux system)